MGAAGRALRQQSTLLGQEADALLNQATKAESALREQAVKNRLTREKIIADAFMEELKIRARGGFMDEELGVQLPPDSYKSQANVEIAEAMEAAVGRIADPQAQFELESYYNSQGLKAVVEVEKLGAQRIVDDSLAAGQAKQDLTLQDIARNPQMIPAEMALKIAQVETYYADLASRNVISQKSAVDTLREFKERAGKVIIQQKTAQLLESGDFEALTDFVGELRAGKLITAAPDTIQPAIDSAVNDFVQRKKLEREEEEKRTQQFEDDVVSDFITRLPDEDFPGANQTGRPNASFEELQAHIDNGWIRDPQKIDKLRDALRTRQEPPTDHAFNLQRLLIKARDKSPQWHRETARELLLQNKITNKQGAELFSEIESWEKGSQSAEEKRVNDQTREIADKIIARVRTSGELMDRFTPENIEENQLVESMIDIARARISQGEHWQSVWRDMALRVDDDLNILRFGRTDIQDIVKKVQAGEPLDAVEMARLVAFEDEKRVLGKQFSPGESEQLIFGEKKIQ